MSALKCRTLQKLNQLSSSYYVDTCRDCIIRRNNRFFFEFYDSAVIIHTYHTKTLDFCLIFTGSADYRDIRTLCDMILKHFIIIHPVYTVTGCDNYIWFMTLFQEINVLIDGICRSLIPQAVVLRNRRCKYKHTSLFTSEIPPFRGT